MNHRPLLSVAMCTYRGSRYLPEQLASIVAQTRLPDELVVRDDGSDDATVDLLHEFKRQAPFLVKVTSGERLGVLANFERVIAACGGALIALADQDDVWHPAKLSLLEAALGPSPQSWLAFSDAELIDSREDRQGGRLWSDLAFDRAEQRRLAADPVGTLLRHPVVSGCTTMFRSELRDLALPFPAGLSMIHDQWLSLCAAAHGPLTLVTRPLLDYRLHADQQVGVVPPPRLVFAPGAVLSPRHLRHVRRPADRHAGHLTELALLQSRLVVHRSEVDPAAVDAVEACIAHLNRRQQLPSGRLARLRPISQELVSGRYSRFGAGWASSAADLLR